MSPLWGPQPPIWRTGPPPFIDWWNASVDENLDIWRFWNGEHWSAPVQSTASLEEVGIAAVTKDLIPIENIKWSNYWPSEATREREKIPEDHTCVFDDLTDDQVRNLKRWLVAFILIMLLAIPATAVIKKKAIVEKPVILDNRQLVVKQR